MKKLIRIIGCVYAISFCGSALANFTGPFSNENPSSPKSSSFTLGIDPSREPWFAELLLEGNDLSSGLVLDQDRVNSLAQHTNRFSLVTQVGVQSGPQLLFAAYLVDTLSADRAFPFLSRATETGMDAIEDLFRSQLNSPLNFDAIFSNYLTYIFQASAGGARIPFKLAQAGTGVVVPVFTPQATIHSLPADVQGSLVPYSFAIFELDHELPANAVVTVSEISAPTCMEGFSLLWKPASPKSIAVYATGCPQLSPQDNIVFRLTITD